MFTGLIEEIGEITSITNGDRSLYLTIKAIKVLDGLKIGDSIAVNGACETVTEISASEFKVFASAETLSVTTFSEFKVGSKVNLERTLRLCDRLDGHMVSGHVDTIGKLKNVQNNGESIEFSFEIDKRYLKQIVKKGSITVNGISLTVARLEGNIFTVAVIPHTIQNTTLKHLKIGDNVNIETDMIAKYVENYLSSDHNKSNIDLDMLERNGFL